MTASVAIGGTLSRRRAMRTIYTLLSVSALLFAGSVAFFVLGVRNAAAPPAAEPVASVKQIMNGIVAPSSKAIYDSVSTVVTSQGTTETVPRTARDWEIVGSHAVALVEAANLMKVGGRARDRGDWTRLSDMMAKAAMQSYHAAEKKDVEALLASGEQLNNSCDSCHRNYEINIE